MKPTERGPFAQSFPLSLSFFGQSSLRVVSVALLALVVGIVLPPSSARGDARFDLDDDGLSELIQLTIQEDDTIDWKVLSSASGYAESVSEKEEFGEAGIAVAVADWRGDGGVDYAYVEKRNGTKLKWDIENGSDVDTYAFGGVAHFALAALDIDASGAADAITMSKRGNIVARLDPFASGSGELKTKLPRRTTRKIKTGAAEPFYFKDSDGVRVGVVYQNKAGTRYRYLAHNFTSSQRQSARLGVVRGDIIEVVEIADGNGTPYILLQEKYRKNKSRVRIFALDGTQAFAGTYTGRTLVVGNYAGSATGEQFAVQDGATLTVVSPFDGGLTSDITLQSDSVIADLANVNDFSTSGGGSGGSNPGLNSVCPNTFDFGPGRLWKPDADASDSRKHKPVVLFTGSNKTGDSALTVYDSQGNVVCSGLTFKSSSIPGVNGGADHYFSGWIGGCGLTAGQIASAAQSNTGSRTVYVEWKSNACLRVPEPNNRYGGI